MRKHGEDYDKSLLRACLIHPEGSKGCLKDAADFIFFIYSNEVKEKSHKIINQYITTISETIKKLKVYIYIYTYI